MYILLYIFNHPVFVAGRVRLRRGPLPFSAVTRALDVQDVKCLEGEGDANGRAPLPAPDEDRRYQPPEPTARQEFVFTLPHPSSSSPSTHYITIFLIKVEEPNFACPSTHLSCPKVEPILLGR